MAEKPELKDDKVVACLANEFGLAVEAITFLPLGADLNTAVYRVAAGDGTNYFLKLRQGEFHEAAVAVPNFLDRQGIKQIIPAIMTQTGQLWASLGPLKVILYPYVEGRDGYEAKLSEQQWAVFGKALKSFHTADVPSQITRGLPRETFSPRWRQIVASHVVHIEDTVYDEPVAAEMAAFLKSKRDETAKLVERAGWLAQALRTNPLESILCHGDIHGWNLLIDATGALYMVDWDTLIFAPKERDLMFIGGGLGDSGYTPQEEEALFYRGYGQTEVNPVAMAYYRYERIIEDIAIYCEQIFLSNKGGEDRNQALVNLKSNYRPGGTIDVARSTYRALTVD